MVYLDTEILSILFLSILAISYHYPLKLSLSTLLKPKPKGSKMAKSIRFFKKDHLVTDQKGKPLGRVVLMGDYHENEPIKVSVLSVPKSFQIDLKSYTFYVDGNPYEIDKSTPDVRFSEGVDKLFVNNFWLVPK